MMTRACRLNNDWVYIRRLITKKLLEVLIFEISRVLPNQYYLVVMYRAMFALLYYGFFQIRELAMGDHPVRAANVHIALNKRKMLFILFTSKTHGLSPANQDNRTRRFTR